MNFPDKLRKLRKERGLTQEELSNSIYISRTMITKYENGIVYLTKENIEKIAFLNVKISDLIDESVRKFDINLSYWQSLDKLSSLDSTAYLEVLNSENKWVIATDLINDVNLSTDRTHQETYSYNYVGNEIWGIRITMTSPATGSRNLGRISIGNLTMIHTI